MGLVMSRAAAVSQLIFNMSVTSLQVQKSQGEVASLAMAHQTLRSRSVARSSPLGPAGDRDPLPQIPFVVSVNPHDA
jgi:hypothetical protein